MKVGDLVEHNPHRSEDEILQALYKKFDADFKVGLVVNIRESFCLIAPERGKPAWYQVEELKIISES